MVRQLDTSMLDDTPGPRRTPLAHMVVDRLLPKRPRGGQCDKHCHCVTEMRLMVRLLFTVFMACLAYFIPREIYGWMRAREVAPAPIVTSTAERNAIDRAPPRDAGRP